MQQLPSLRNRFALIIVLLIVCLSWLFGTLIGHDAGERIHREIGQDLAETAYSMVDRLDRDMQNRAAMLQVIASLNSLKETDEVHEVRQLLDHLQNQFPSIAWIGLTDAQGTVLASSNGVLEGISIAQRPVYLEAQKQMFIGDVHEAILLAKLLPNPTGEAMKFVDISIPINATDGRLIGVLAAHLSWSWAEDVRQSLLEPMEKGRNVEFFVLSKDQSVLLGPKSSIGLPLQLPMLQASRSPKESWAVERWPDNRQYLTGVAHSQGYKNYSGLGWTVVARQPLEDAYAPARAMTLNIIYWGSALALLFALLGWLLAGYFTQPLRQIARAADRLSAGKASVIPALKGTREIQTLSNSIRHLVDSLSNQQNALGAMENLAHHDGLTGLPNRIALNSYLSRAQQISRLSNSCLALLYMDLDGFKPINDQYGHAAGDKLLQEVAQRLRSSLREGDLVARLGGDEFLMVLQVPHSGALDQAQLVAERTLETLRQPIELEQQVQVGCSIGGAIWPQDNAQLDVTLELADRALYQAKESGRNCIRFHHQRLS